MSAIPLQLGGLSLAFPSLTGALPARTTRGRAARTGSARRIIPAQLTRGELASGTEHVVKDWTDESLLAAYVEGNRAAFRELIGRYREELLHFLIRFLGSRTSAEDVFQETFLQVHLSADTFDPTRRLRPWLFTIAANKGRDHHRKHGRRQPVSLSASIGGDRDGQSFVDLMQTDLPGPASPVLDAERSRLVKKVVDSLAPHLREILLLSYFQRMSYTQIAETLEIPLGTVKSRLHTAVATFARAWSATPGANDLDREDRVSEGDTPDGRTE